MSFITHQTTATFAEMMEGAARTMNGERGLDMLRRQSCSITAGNFSLKALEQKVLDYYYHSCANKGELKQAHEFKQCANHFEAIYQTRLGVNVEAMRKTLASGCPLAIAMLPCQFMLKQQPTSEQRQAWMRRWDDDGTFFKAFKRHVPNGIVMPYIHMGASTDMPIQLCVMMVSVNCELATILTEGRVGTVGAAEGGSGGDAAVEGDPTAPATADGEDEFPSIVVKAKKARM